MLADRFGVLDRPGPNRGVFVFDLPQQRGDLFHGFIDKANAAIATGDLNLVGKPTVRRHDHGHARNEHFQKYATATRDVTIGIVQEQSHVS